MGVDIFAVSQYSGDSVVQSVICGLISPFENSSGSGSSGGGEFHFLSGVRRSPQSMIPFVSLCRKTMSLTRRLRGSGCRSNCIS